MFIDNAAACQQIALHASKFLDASKDGVQLDLRSQGRLAGLSLVTSLFTWTGRLLVVGASVSTSLGWVPFFLLLFFFFFFFFFFFPRNFRNHFNLCWLTSAMTISHARAVVSFTLILRRHDCVSHFI
jgi:hypothetical protein